MAMSPDFRVYLNSGRQWIGVYVAKSPRKFLLAENCYGYYQPAKPRKTRRGHFGDVHLSKVGGGLVAHELQHALWDWMRCRSVIPTPDNEEKIVTLFGEMTKSFWRNYYRWENRHSDA